MERLLGNSSSAQTEITKIPRLLLAHRWRIFWFTTAVFVAAAIVNFSEPNYYTSTGTLLPTGNQSSGSALGSLAGAIPALDLMRTDADPTASSQLFPDILESDVVRSRVLGTRLPAEISAEVEGSTVGEVVSANPVKAMKVLAAKSKIGKDKNTGIVSVEFEWTNAEFAQFVAAEYIRQLDQFCSSERFARLDENRSFVQGRLLETEARLQSAEDSLLQYREQNRNYYMGSSPELQLEHERLVRKVAEVGEVYALLTQQLEMATIEAKRKKPVVAVLDTPVVPMEKSGPRRLSNIMQITLAALLVSCGAVVFGNYVRSYMSREDLQQMEKIRGDIGTRVAMVRSRITLRKKAQV